MAAAGHVVRRLSQAVDTDAVAGYVFLAPYLLFLAAFLVYPVANGLYMSFHDWEVFTEPEWTGLGNYVRLMGDQSFLASVWHTVYFVLLTTGPLVVLGLLVAAGLNGEFLGRTVVRAGYFYPYLLSVTVVGVIWRWILQGEYGLLNYYLGMVGLPKLRWLGDARWAMPSIAIATIWWTLGFNVVVFLAALQDIPRDLIEAARVDGATRMQVFRHITLPLLTPATVFVVIMQVIASFQIFGQVYVMTGGGPYGSTRTVVQYLYEQGFRYFKMGYASAIGYALFAIMFLFTIVQWRLFHGTREARHGGR